MKLVDALITPQPTHPYVHRYYAHIFKRRPIWGHLSSGSLQSSNQWSNKVSLKCRLHYVALWHRFEFVSLRRLSNQSFSLIALFNCTEKRSNAIRRLCYGALSSGLWPSKPCLYKPLRESMMPASKIGRAAPILFNWFFSIQWQIHLSMRAFVHSFIAYAFKAQP